MSCEALETSGPGAAPSAATVEYLGSKRRLVHRLVPTIRSRIGSAPDVTDLFAGTGSVSAGLKAAGLRVTANDHLTFCSHFARSLLSLSRAPTFGGLGGMPYLEALATLDRLDGQEGFIHRNYSPASRRYSDVERQYFTEENAARVDAIRHQIELWRPSLTDAEYSLLITDLLRSVSTVSNVAGTYGCYLKYWKLRALEPLTLQPSTFVRGDAAGHSIRTQEALELLKEQPTPVVYADPPYTKRQYAAYYHILETIALYDNPEISGSTGLREWSSKASDFCYKRRAPQALVDLLLAADCDHFFLSYSADGQIPHRDVLEILGDFGSVDTIEWILPRYRSSALKHRSSTVIERLYHVQMSA